MKMNIKQVKIVWLSALIKNVRKIPVIKNGILMLKGFILLVVQRLFKMLA